MPLTATDITEQVFANAATLSAAARKVVSTAQQGDTLTIGIAATSEPVFLELGGSGLSAIRQLKCSNAAQNLRLFVRAGGQNPEKLSLEFMNTENCGAALFVAVDNSRAEVRCDIQLKKNSRFSFFSGITSDADLEVNAEVAEGVDAQFFGLTRVKGREEAHLTMHVKHIEGKNHTDQKFYSYAADEAAVTFTGRITVLPGAGESAAHQLHRGTALSAGARISAQPFLNILHDDVRCTHGSTVGFIDEHAKRYLMARGMNAAMAEKILIESSQSQFVAALPEGTAAFFGLAGDE